MPPCILGCSVLTRPPSISGAPVTSETGTTGTRASSNALAVPPVEMISNPILCSWRANAATPSCPTPKPAPDASYLHPSPEIVRDRPHEQPVLDRVQPLQQRLLRVPRQHRHRLLRIIGPASTSSTMKCTVTPVSSTPASSARFTASSPLNSGRSDGWTFITAGNRSRNTGVRTRMYPAPTTSPTSCGRNPLRQLRVELLARLEVRRVHELDRHPGQPRPLERERLLPVPGDHAQAPGDRHPAAPAGSSPSPRRAPRTASPRADRSDKLDSPVVSATTSPMRHASHPASRSTASALASPASAGTTAQNPTPRLKTRRISSSGTPPEERINPKTAGSSQTEASMRAPRPPRARGRLPGRPPPVMCAIPRTSTASRRARISRT